MSEPEYRIEQPSWLKPPKKWALVRRMSNTRIGWDVIGAFETEQEAKAALKQHKSNPSK